MPVGLARREEQEAARLRLILPDRLSQALKSSGLNRRALADIIGVHLNTVHAYASGLRFPRLTQLTLLAKALDVSLDWFLDQSSTGDLGHELRPVEQEVLEYVALENQRGHYPTFVEISHSFDAEPYWASPFVRKLVRFGLLTHAGGFKVTKTGSTRTSSVQAPKTTRRMKRTPLRYARTPVRWRRTPITWAR